jgi:hypothetical protein
MADGTLFVGTLSVDPYAEVLKGFVVRFLGKAEKKGHTKAKSLGVGIRYVDEKILGKMRLLHIGGNAADLFIREKVDFAVGRQLELIQKLEESGSRTVPIHGTFVTASVRGDRIVIALGIPKNFPDGSCFSPFVLLAEQKYGQHVGKDPRVPVVDLFAAVSHPLEIKAAFIGRLDTAVQLVGNTVYDLGAERKEGRLEERDRYGKMLCRFRGKEVDVGLGRGGNTGTFKFIIEAMSGNAPIAFLTDGKKSVDDLGKEASFILLQLGKDEKKEVITAVKMRPFHDRALSAFDEFHKIGGLDDGPCVGKLRFRQGDTLLVLESVPKGSVLYGGEEVGAEGEIGQIVRL